MATISEALALAIQQHQAGRLAEAEQIYGRILQVDPHHPDALHLLGVLAHHVGRYDIAVEHMGRAIGLKGTEAVFHHDLGKAYFAWQRLAEAAACYRQALQLKPDYAEAHNGLGQVLKEQGKLEEASPATAGPSP